MKDFGIGMILTILAMIIFAAPYIYAAALIILALFVIVVAVLAVLNIGGMLFAWLTAGDNNDREENF